MGFIIAVSLIFIGSIMVASARANMTVAQYIRSVLASRKGSKIDTLH